MGELTTIEPTHESAVPAPITPAQMLGIAVQQGADLAKLEKLMDLQDRWERTQAQKAYVAALSEFRAECPIIARKQAGHNARKYAGLADALDQVNRLLARVGLSHSWATQQEGQLITVTCTVTHRGGHSESTSLTALPDTTGAKNAIQSVGSTVTYLQRYTLFSILGLASAEQDDDGEASGEDAEYSRWLSAIDDAPDLATLDDIAAELAKAQMPVSDKGKLRAAFAVRKHALKVAA